MRHRKKTIKLGRTSSHRDALLSGLVCNLIIRKRITTTLPKAKAARSLAERMVTLGKQGDLAARRRAISKLHQVDTVATLFSAVAPAFKDRAGGYTRIMKLGRRSDSAEMAILEWVNYVPEPPKKKEGPKGEAKAAEAASEDKSGGGAAPTKKGSPARKKEEAKV
jgi:large subunit ribosomal protein L17